MTLNAGEKIALPGTAEGKNIVFFDGVCNLCNRTVQTIIKNDKKDRFRFAPLQSKLGKRLKEAYSLKEKNIDSIILLDQHRQIFVKSSAALQIAKNLPRYKWLVPFLAVPRSWRDFFYDRIARNRYKWFGKRSQCMVPSRALQKKFLDD